MKTLKLIWNRLKKPHVLLGILSQIIIILKAFDVSIDTDMLSIITTAICSILVLMGIIGDPDDSSGFCSEIKQCEKCGQTSCHIKIGDFLICRNCGHQIPLSSDTSEVRKAAQ
ncbi:MAG: hypothetical protein SOZ34_08560 [Clostridia bacterium]|nr:hypothetical protein [Clostridia bacterium]